MNPIFNFLFNKHGWIRHILFWAVSLWVMTYMASQNSIPTKIDVLYALMIHAALLPLAYINIRVLIPYLFSKEKPLAYLGCVLIMLAVCFGIHHFTFIWVVPELSRWSLYMVDFMPTSSLIFLLAIYWGVSTLLTLSKGWWRSQQLERENLKLSLQALEAQINPHFLFNSLHSLYALALKKSDQTPELLLSLSNMLRYMLYRTQEEFVPIEEEINYLNDYIAFQRLRSEDTVSIGWEISGNPKGVQIAPLLMVPLIENAFKHGIGPGDSEIHLLLEISEHQVNLRTTNTLWPKKAQAQQDGGIGIENVRKRLVMVYPDRHALSIKSTEDEFSINLTLQLS